MTAIVHPRHPHPRPAAPSVVDASVVQPPGQLEAFPPAPRARATSYRVLHLAYCGSVRSSDAIRDLPIAAARAARTAAERGEAWIVDADGASCHIDADGAVTVQSGELSGWPLLAARVITQNRNPS